MSDAEVLTPKESKVHFTYKKDANFESLCQGDLLSITGEMRKILEEVHPYFLHKQYKYFMVLTQSCDLVRRDGINCKTPYITLAAVRSFDDFFERQLISSRCAEEINGYLLMDSKQKERAYQLLERLYNNTEPDYFFLYKEDALQLPESMVACLKVSIALKSKLHYQECLQAKKIELSDEFKAKLGWLVGNIYSRVGTTDWESILTAGARRAMLEEELCNHCIIGLKEQIRALKEELRNNSEHLQSREAVMDYVTSFSVESKYDKVISIIEQVFSTSSNKISKQEKERLLMAIKSRSALKALLSN